MFELKLTIIQEGAGANSVHEFKAWEDLHVFVEKKMGIEPEAPIVDEDAVEETVLEEEAVEDVKEKEETPDEIALQEKAELADSENKE